MTVHKNQPFIHRLRFALAGLAAAWRTEQNFRVQLAVLVIVLIGLAVLKVEPLWWVGDTAVRPSLRCTPLLPSR